MNPTLLFIHGAGGNHKILENQTKSFSGTLAIDLPGHGVGVGKKTNNEYVLEGKKFCDETTGEAIKKGEIRKDVDPESFSTILPAALNGLELHWAVLERDFDWRKIHATFCKVIISGLKPQKRVEDR